MNNSIRRINHSVLAGTEKHIIVYLIKLLPKWVTPDMLTILGLYAAIGSGVAYVLSDQSLSFLYWSSLMILVNWFGDSLDGSLAYYQQSENHAYGLYFDHVIDAFSILAVCLGLTISSLTATSIWMLFAFGYILFELHAALSGWNSRSHQISWNAIGPTELRLFLILFNFIGIFFARHILYIMDFTWYFFDVLGFIASCVLFMFLLIEILKTLRMFKKPLI